MKIQFSFKSFIISIILLIILIFIAVFVRDNFIRPFIGDVLAVIWLYYLLKSFFKTDFYVLSIAVLVFSFLIEGAQYFKLIDILGIKHIKPLRIILGSTFDLKDLAAYCIGWCIIISIEILMLKKSKTPK